MRIILKRFWHNWKEMGEYIGDFQARLLLTLFYFSILVPFGFLLRLFGDPLHVRKLPVKSSWIQRSDESPDLDAARRQF